MLHCRPDGSYISHILNIRIQQYGSQVVSRLISKVVMRERRGSVASSFRGRRRPSVCVWNVSRRLGYTEAKRSRN